ncbi:hypothetical protein FPJ27_36835 (plasmid) [Burkholderia sp. MS455]|uniref:hypothetical protein n=1 Tax=Burkholderia sp. MS455 TaxID=2811788 RepID=UPI001959148C|nr:hypothetical protein [Burkholderia sp. MS455]QRR11776.1 hypothetical protein FPJ27_36835 [Burkholderia sp. MS455]
MSRSVVCFFYFQVATVNSASIFLLAMNSTETLMLETNSVRRLGMGKLGFSAKAVFSRGYRPAGATETIAIAVTDYEMHCWGARVGETAVRELTNEDEDAGSAPAINQMWKTIEPRSNFDVFRDKICQFPLPTKTSFLTNPLTLYVKGNLGSILRLCRSVPLHWLFAIMAIGDVEESIGRNAQAQEMAKSSANYLKGKIDFPNVVAKSAIYQFRYGNGHVDLGWLGTIGLMSRPSERLVTLVNIQGVALQAWPPPIGEVVNNGDREYIINQLNFAVDDLYIGTPAIGRVPNTLTLQFTRKIFDRDDRVAGAVVSEPTDCYTRSFANQTNLGANGQLLAFRMDGRLLVRASSNRQPTSSGKSLDQYPLGKPRGVFARDPLDHRLRLYVRESPPGYPITAAVALSKQDICGDYELTL